MGSPELFGKYLVFEQLGRGGMATVHRAETRGIAGFRRPVALKRMLPGIADDPEQVQLFVDEARLASYLHHTNIAQTYEFGRVDDVYFIAMEYVAGPTLMQLIRQCVAAAGSIPLPIALHILIEICNALEYAHDLCDERGRPLGIIHRDVSPSNVIVSNAGVAKLIDFGIAKARLTSQTQVGVVKGKFGYIAPEYLGGQIDRRADLFGFGVIAFELLAGMRLFHVADELETLERLQTMEVPAPSTINRKITPDVDDIILTALQRDPARRWQSAGAMRTALVNASRALGEVVVGKSVVTWLEWAFTQETSIRDEIGIPRILDDLSQAIEPPLELMFPDPPEPPEPLEPLEPLAKAPAVAETGPTTIAPRRAPSRSIAPWLPIVAAIAAGLAAWYFQTH
jgi:serine/threonine-protein kinase